MANNGIIGDIKYSILEPVDFEIQNGPGWVLMNGQAIQQNWDLFIEVLQRFSPHDENNPYKTIMNNLPDASGVFLRGMNNSAVGNDPFAVENDNRVRKVGEFQGDSIGKHNHGLNGTYNVFNLTGPSTKLTLLQASGSEPSEFNTGNVNETRPKNVSVYTYIKINH